MTRKITLEDIKEYCKPRCLTIISNELLHELTSNRTRRMFQQISNDAVSRQEVKRIAKEMYLEVANMNLDVNSISDCISYTSSKCRQAFEDKLQALPSVTPKQQPCDDAISRKAVLKIIRDWWKRTIMADGEPTVLCDSIRALSSVTRRQRDAEIVKSYIHEIITESGIDKNQHTNEVLRKIADEIMHEE